MTARRVECWACGAPVQAPTREELVAGLAEHLREAHGDAEPDRAQLEAWIDRRAAPADRGLRTALTVGQGLAGAAAVTFTVLAFLNPTEIGGLERTIQFMSFLGFAALSGALLCALILLGRLLQR